MIFLKRFASPAVGRARFEAIVAELRTNPNVNVQSVSVGGASTADIAAAMCEADGALPGAMVSLCRGMNGFELGSGLTRCKSELGGGRSVRLRIHRSAADSGGVVCKEHGCASDGH